jgi:hypothetical protein
MHTIIGRAAPGRQAFGRETVISDNCPTIHLSEKPILYEQVNDVKLLFSSWVFAFVVGLRCMLLSTVFVFALLKSRSQSGLGAGWGSRGESMLPFLGRS